MAPWWPNKQLSFLDRYFAASEERHARVDDALKDCGAFRLTPFEGSTSQEHGNIEAFVSAVDRVMSRAADFYSPGDDDHAFKLAGASLSRKSIMTDGTVNDTISVKVVRRGRPSGKAVIIVPHWNAKDGSYTPLAKVLSWFGYDGFIMTLPHHGTRASSSSHVANAFLNADLGAAIRSVRQSVLDVRSLVNWLRRNGYDDVYLIGASLGSCVAALTAAFDPRISRCALLLTAGDFADTVWTGRATAHIRKAIEQDVSLEQLRKAWAIISPVHFSENYTANTTRLLIVSGRRDAVVRFGLAREFVDALKRVDADIQWQVLPCGHYTLSAFPFNVLMVAKLLKFLRK